MKILYIATGLFSVTALGGMYLLSLVLRNKETPKAVALAHGSLAALSILLLVYYTVKRDPQPTESLVLFIMAALGGAVLGYRDFTGKTIPKWLAVGHGLIALSGFAFLLLFIFKK